MPTPRSKQICLEATEYYHCTSRCVRRAFLCGFDIQTERNYDHRRGWIEERLLYLASVFCIDVCAYAVMSNHCHVVLRIDASNANALSDLNIAKRWLRVCKGTLLVQQYVEKGEVNEYEEASLKATLNIYRQRLMDISWFMRMLNEPIARKANEEDECTGRFWEGRFHSQALLGEAALLACMMYVDLNPIRAGIEDTPETSRFTSARQRIESAKNKKQPSTLLPFVGKVKEGMPEGLPFQLEEYLSLLDLTGRCFREGKAGLIANELPDILERLAIPHENWLVLTSQFEVRFPGVAGNTDSLELFVENKQRKRRCNLTNSQALLG